MWDQYRKFVGPLALLAIGIWSYQYSGTEGLAMFFSGLVMWILLHFSTIMIIMRRARRSPIGSVASAGMFQATLKPGVSLLFVIGQARSLGERVSPEGEQPEVYAWHDGYGNRVICHFAEGKLQNWEFKRPKLIIPDPEAQILPPEPTPVKSTVQAAPTAPQNSKETP